MVELAGRFEITSNRESGFGRYDVMLTPKNRERDDAYIIEFKVHKSLKEKDIDQTVANALIQIEEKQYDAKRPQTDFLQSRFINMGLHSEEKNA